MGVKKDIITAFLENTNYNNELSILRRDIVSNIIDNDSKNQMVAVTMIIYMILHVYYNTKL